MVDFVVTKTTTHCNEQLDEKRLTKCNVGGDHYLVVCEIRFNVAWSEKCVKIVTDGRIELENLRDDSPRLFVSKRLE